MGQKKAKYVPQVVYIPFNVGQNVAFVYTGGIRSGRVEKVTPRTITLFDSIRQAYRSFSIAKINK